MIYQVVFYTYVMVGKLPLLICVYNVYDCLIIIYSPDNFKLGDVLEPFTYSWYCAQSLLLYYTYR